MGLPTQGFIGRALPAPLTIPSNVGVVQPLDPARIAQLAVQLRAAAQNESIQNQQAMNADNAARQNIVLARLAESRKQQAFPLEQQAATLENQGRAQNIAQGAEQFITAAPQRALLAKQAQYSQALVGPEGVSETYEKNPDGSYTVTQTETRNGNVISQSKKQAFLPPGMTAAMVGFTKGPVLYDANGGPVSTLQNRMGHVIRADTGEAVDPAQFSAVAPSKAAVAGAVEGAKSGFVGQRALSKEDAQDISEYPQEKAKLANAETALAAELQNIQEAKKLASVYSPRIWANLTAQIPGTDAYNLAAKLQAVQGAAGREALANVKNVRSMAEYNGLTQSLGSIKLAQDPVALQASLDNYAHAATVAYNAAKNAIETRHQQALQRLGQPDFVGAQGGGQVEEIAHNPQTGEELVKRNGQWVPRTP